MSDWKLGDKCICVTTWIHGTLYKVPTYGQELTIRDIKYDVLTNTSSFRFVEVINTTIPYGEECWFNEFGSYSKIPLFIKLEQSTPIKRKMLF